MRRLGRLSAAVLVLCACEVVAPLDALKVVDATVGDAGVADAGVADASDTLDAAVTPMPDAAVVPPDAASVTPDAASVTPDAAPTPDAAAPPMCLVDADCAPQLCRGGVCVDRVQLVADVPPIIDASDPIDVLTLSANSDEDALPDLAILNGTTSEVHVLIGVGDGTFTARFGPFPAGPGAVALAKGNFDDELGEDIVVANNDDATVTILHGVGDGDFTVDAAVVASDAPGPGGAASIAAGPLDLDDLDDLAVADQGISALSVLSGTRPPLDPGYVSAPLAVANVPRPASLTAGPLTLGADPSVVGVDEGNGHGFIYTNVGGTFQLALDWLPNDGALNRVTLADVDEDGVLDLIGTVPGANRVVIRFDAGGEASLAAGPQPTDARAADLDGDLHLDAVMIHGDDATVGVNCSDGAGGFERDLRIFNVGSGPTRLVTEDLNFDGLPDVIVISGLDQRVDVLMNRSPGPSP